MPADLTYRPLITTDLWVPGDIFGGALLHGWRGPWEAQVHDGLRLRWCSWTDTDGLAHRASRLDCNSPEVRDHVRRVLLSMRHDIGPIIGAELRGDVTPTEAAALVWCSLLRVEAGMWVVRGWRTPLDAAIVWCLPGAPKDAILRAEHSGEPRHAALSNGFALREPDAILLPLPGGVVGRLEVTDVR